MKLLNKLYNEKVRTPSDINEHLETLREYCQGLRVVECGVRNVVSSYAFAMGNCELTMVDIEKSPEVGYFIGFVYPQAKFILGNDIEIEPIDTDVLFLDTWHVYGHLKRELNHWHEHVRKYIILHDTEVDAEHGESIRCGHNIPELSMRFKIPEHEIRRGMKPAIDEFLEENPNWQLLLHFKNNNGLTILRNFNKMWD